MGKRETYRLGDLQLAIMKVLWAGGDSSVSQVQQALRPRNLAYTTVATMLRKMEARGLVEHVQVERKFLYRTRVPQGAVTRGMASDLLDRLFGGSLASLVSHLLTSREVGREELARLERLVARERRRRS